MKKKTHIDLTTLNNAAVMAIKDALRESNITYRTRKDGVMVCTHDADISVHRLCDNVVSNNA